MKNSGNLKVVFHKGIPFLSFQEEVYRVSDTTMSAVEPREELGDEGVEDMIILK